MLAVRTYLREVKNEAAQVSWPNRAQTQKLTLIVIAVSAGVSIYLGLLDFVFQRAMTILL